MRVAILSESPADAAALKMLAEAVLGESIEVAPFRTRVGGIDAVYSDLAAVLKNVHYRQSAEALIVAVDSDNSPVHSDGHEQFAIGVERCRLCGFRRNIESIRSTLKPVVGRSPILTAVAVPTPAIEAWYLCGEDSQCTEAEWIRQQAEKRSASAEIRRLKRRVYGTDQPGLDLETERALRNCAARVPQLAELERWFPNSFGIFARELRMWKSG